MAQTKTVLSANKRILAGAKALYLTPFTKSGDSFVPGTTTYEVTQIVGDSISISQDDNNENLIESEFTSSPLFDNVTLGNIQFSATCIDIEDTVLTSILGWTKPASGTGVYAPSSYSEAYCAVEVVFNSYSFVLPKVQMNSKVTLESLKTGTAKVELAGTAMTAYVKAGEETDTTKTVACVIPTTCTSLTIDTVDIKATA